VSFIISIVELLELKKKNYVLWIYFIEVVDIFVFLYYVAAENFPE